MQCTYRYIHASKRFVEVYPKVFTCIVGRTLIYMATSGQNVGLTLIILTVVSIIPPYLGGFI